jgi:hypothetical protein
MQFADPQAISTAYLVLRHLYDGDVIDWPIAEDHPLHHVFAGLEAQGYIARWDRVWPLQDRYRLTEKGIATIEAVYRPSGAEQFMNQLREQKMSPAQRRAYLQQQRLDPVLWPLLHDPSTHWSNFGQTGSRYQSWFWEDQRPKQTRHARRPGTSAPRHPSPPVHHDPQPVPYLVDLDRQAHDPTAIAPAAADYDVS